MFSGGDGFMGLSQEGMIWFIVAAVALILLSLLLGGKRFGGPPVGDEIKKRQAEIAAEEAAVGERA